MKPLKILFKFTTRSRRGQFLDAYDTIINNVWDKEDYHVLISVENELEDPKMHPLPVLRGNYTYAVNPGKPTTKVDAINRDVEGFDYDWDILINMSDDMYFIKAGFDDAIRRYFQESLDRSLLFFDGNRQDLITMSILGRDYYNRDGYIYHPDYKSLWCDNEATEVAEQRGCLVRCREHLFTHQHPAYGYRPMDEQYRITESFNGEDSRTYLKRKMNGFA